MIYEVDGWNNFCRVFELPETYPQEYCFGGGHEVSFKMVDWFYPVSYVSMTGCSKEEWRKEVGPIKSTIVTEDGLRDKLLDFLLGKQYVLPGRKYLLLCDFGLSFTFEKPDE